MTKVLFQKGTVILWPADTDALLSDLASGDKAALERWRTHLYISARYDSNYNAALASSGLKETLALYTAREKPGRSNFFNRLVWDVRAELQKKPLSKQAVLTLLGQPDVTTNGPDGEIILYKCASYGRDCFSWLTVSNEMVLRVDIGVR